MGMIAVYDGKRAHLGRYAYEKDILLYDRQLQNDMKGIL